MDTNTMLEKVNSTDMTAWSDIKRKDFVKTFDDRVKASQYVLTHMFKIIRDDTLNKKFISTKHLKKLGNPGNDFYGAHSIGGRNVSDLNEVAQSNARDAVKSLPPLKKAVEVIDKDTATMIDKKEKLEAKGQKLTDELIEVTETIDMADLDQKMTIGDFRTMVKSKENRRDKLVLELNTIGKEASELDVAINKKLYAGIPGLSDAVVNVLQGTLDKIKLLDQMGRRIGEKVMFGDSEAAMEILRTFEKDEVNLSVDVAKQLKEAVEKLGVSKKQLSAPAKKTTKKAKK